MSIFNRASVKSLAQLVFTEVNPYTTILGAEQTLSFTDDQTLLDVLCITDGVALTRFDRAALDAFKPAWRTDTAAAVQQWSPIEGQPLRFLTWPPATAGQSLDVKSVRVPATYAIGDTIDLPASLESTLAAFVIFFAEQKDDEHVNSGRSAASYQPFVGLLKGTSA